MYISKIEISSFRNYKDSHIQFHEGINVLIGANNSGKSNLLKAIALALNIDQHNKCSIQDIFHETDVDLLKEKSPRIHISIHLSQSSGEDDSSEEAGVIANYLLSLDHPYEAIINFEYTLSEDKETLYKESVSSLNASEDIWNTIIHDFSRYYETFRWGGTGSKAKEKLNDFYDILDFQFLNAIRDVSRDMCKGYNPLLRDILNFFLDYTIKTEDIDETDRQSKIERENRSFKELSLPLMENINQRLRAGKERFLDYAQKIGVSLGNSIPDLSGNITESDLLTLLNLVIKNENATVPASSNGLGYNNLIYISLLLAKMQTLTDGNYLGRNAKLFSILAIEEPEAHLHPSMQYQLMQFLRQNMNQHHLKQIFLTTHSTEIVSSTPLHELICLRKISYNNIHVGYPNLQLSGNEKNNISKKYIQRFLDATKADMFFAEKIIFVEGIAETLLIPIFAKYLGINLVEKHILIINISGRYFSHFIKLFDEKEGDNYIHKKIACITDIDPMHNNQRCYPYEFIPGNAKYSHNANEEFEKYQDNLLIRFFRGNNIYGKTLEYDIMFENPLNPLLITASLKNKEEFKSLLENKDASIDTLYPILKKSEENERIINSLKQSQWDEDIKKKSLYASRYLNSVSKGENALELCMKLQENLECKGSSQYIDFEVPQYIIDAITWIVQ